MNQIQIIAIIGSILFLFLIIELIRKKRIKEQYSLLWLFFGIIFIIISVWKNSLEILGKLLGISYTPVAFLLVLIVSLILILIQYSMVISKLSEQNKNLVQEIGLLRMEIEKIKNLSLLNKKEKQ